MIRERKGKAEEKFPISEQEYIIGKLLDGKEFQIFLDTAASKSFMSKSHNLRCKSLHSLSEVCIQNLGNSSRKWTVC